MGLLKAQGFSCCSAVVLLSLSLDVGAQTTQEMYIDSVLGANSVNLDPFPFGGSAAVSATLCTNFYTTFSFFGFTFNFPRNYLYRVEEDAVAPFELCDASIPACATVDVTIETEAYADGVAGTTTYLGNSPNGTLCPAGGATTQTIEISYPAFVPAPAGTYTGIFEINGQPTGAGTGPVADLTINMDMPELVLIQRLASGDSGTLDLSFSPGSSDLDDEAHFCIYSNELDGTGLSITADATASGGAPVLNSPTTGLNVPYAFVLSTGSGGSGTQVIQIASDGSSGFTGSASGTVNSADFSSSLDASANCVSLTHYLQVEVDDLDAAQVDPATDYTDTITLTVEPD